MEEHNALLAPEMSEPQAAQADIVSNDLIIKFRKPYLFEGKEYTEVNLVGLADITTEDMLKAERMTVQRTQQLLAMTEVTTDYAVCMASIVAGKPELFFEKMPAVEMRKVKSAISTYFFALE